jgi:hypothetical protein
MIEYETFVLLPDAARTEAMEYLRLGQSEFTVQELLADEHQARLSLEAIAASQAQPPPAPTPSADSTATDYAAQALTELKKWALDFASHRRPDVRLLHTLFNILFRAETLEQTKRRLESPPPAEPDYNRPFTPDEARAVIRKVEEVFCLCGPNTPLTDADIEIVTSGRQFPVPPSQS